MPIEEDPRLQQRSLDNDSGGGSGTAGNSRGSGSALGYPFKYRNCRRSKLPKPVPVTTSNGNHHQQQQQHKKYPSEEMLYNEPNLVPKMELLKINYFNVPRKSTVQLKQLTSRSRSSVQDIKDDLIKKCGGGSGGRDYHTSSTATPPVANKSIKVPETNKYAVYKKHNLHENDHDRHGLQRRGLGGSPAVVEKNSKVFDFDSVKFRKKYFLFDTKKRSKKLDNIQFYFDKESYERHVDNKLYGSAVAPQRSSTSSGHHLYGQASGSVNRRQEQQLPSQPSKLSSWKDHLNSNRMSGHVRELQHKYENRTRQQQSSVETSRGHQQKRVKGDEDLGRHQQKREKSIHYGVISSDTDKLIKSNSGASHQHHHHSRRHQATEDEQQKKKLSSLQCKKSRESTTENESNGSNKIKRLVQGYESSKSPLSPRNSVEGRENFILFQRIGSVDNLPVKNSCGNKVLSDRNKYGANQRPLSSSAVLDGVNKNMKSNDSTENGGDVNYYMNGNGNQSLTVRQPLCKNIRTPRPTSMPISSGSTSQLENTNLAEKKRIDSERSSKSTGGLIKQHCGYKNCQFQNCPMTASSMSTSSGCDSSSSSNVSYASCEGSPINIVHRNHSADVKTSTNKQKSNERNVKDHSSSAVVKSMIPKSRTERISNIKQLERRIVTKYISDELRLLSNTARDEMDDGYEPISSPGSRESEAEYERNKVKIYVGGTFAGKKDSSFMADVDSDKDYGYYDQVTADSGSCSEDSYGSRRKRDELKKKQQMQKEEQDSNAISDDSLINIMDMSSDLMGKLGCDGAIFWNENCYEDECKVQCSVKEPYVCVCGSTSKVLPRKLNTKALIIPIGIYIHLQLERILVRENKSFVNNNNIWGNILNNLSNHLSPLICPLPG